MLNKKRAKWRKARINEIVDGSGITDYTIKRSVDVLNSVFEELICSINKSSKASNCLSVVLVIATIIIALVSVGNLYVTISHNLNNVSNISSELSK